jgi:hypothetical protein
MQSSIDRMGAGIEVSGDGMPLLGGIEQHRTTSVSTPEGAETKRCDNPPFIHLDVLQGEKCHGARGPRRARKGPSSLSPQAVGECFDPPRHWQPNGRKS